jgi:hypothetical protein
MTTRAFVINTAAFALLAAPVAVSAQLPSLIVCDGTKTDPCDFPAFIRFVQAAMNWMMIAAVPLSTIAFAYAGYLYMTAGSSPSNRSKANGIFTAVITGIVIMAVAWFVVRLILTILAKPEFTQLLKLN